MTPHIDLGDLPILRFFMTTIPEKAGPIADGAEVTEAEPSNRNEPPATYPPARR